MRRSTKLKIAAAVVLAVTIAGTIVTALILPVAAPIVAGAGTTVAALFGHEIISQLVTRALSAIFPSHGETSTEIISYPDRKYEINHRQIVTCENAKSKSGYHIRRLIKIDEELALNHKQNNDTPKKPRL